MKNEDQMLAAYLTRKAAADYSYLLINMEISSYNIMCALYL